MRGLIVLGGDAPGKELLLWRARWADWIVAADSGLACALDAGIRVDMAVGDFDSVAEGLVQRAEKLGCEIRALPKAKDQTDGQEALDTALARGANEIALLGGFGGRFDHQFAHICLLVRAVRRGARAFLESETTHVECFGPGVASLEGRRGEELSILPLGDGLFVERVEGLAYPIDQKPMPVEFPFGISNVFTAQQAKVYIRGGLAVVVRNKA